MKRTYLIKSSQIVAIIIATLLISSCNRNKFKHDASGTFEATEVIVASQASGQIESLDIKEGDILRPNQIVGFIDTTQLYLKKIQIETTMKAISGRRLDVNLQIAATKEQITRALIEKNRVENLFKDGAATQKQMDDISTQLAVFRRTLAAQENSLSATDNSLDLETKAYAVQVKQINDQIAKSYIVNPIQGTVLNKYTEGKEMTTLGKPIFKVADTKNLFLRAYVIAPQLEKVSVGKNVTVYVNSSNGKQNALKGIVTWISDKAEFTPKTIQTEDERQNLVYALKISVNNQDGNVKIGMYGDVDFK